METRYRSMTERMKGAALLQVDVYEEVEHDGTATSQAAGVVAIVAVCAAVGGIGTGAGGILTGLLGAFVGWLLATGLVAIRQALDVSTGKAVMTALLGWLSYVVIGLLLALLFGLPTLGS